MNQQLHMARKTIMMDEAMQELAIRKAQVILVTDPTRETWYSIGPGIYRTKGTKLPPAGWISRDCTILDVSRIDEVYDEFVAKIIADYSDEVKGIDNLPGLTKALKGLGADLAHIIADGKLMVIRELKPDDHAYERDDRDPNYWRTDQTALAEELRDPSDEPGEPPAWAERLEAHKAGEHHKLSTVDPECETCQAIRDGKCPHMRVTITWVQMAAATRYEPAEHEGTATCNDCGESMSPEDVPAEAERTEGTVSKREARIRQYPK